MSNCVQSLRARTSLGAHAERDFEELEGAIDSAFSIARELIATGVPPAGQVGVADVNEVVLQMQGVLARILGDTIQVSLRLDAVDGLVEAEAVQLEWVLLNLAANSRDAMPQGGMLQIQTTAVTRHVVEQARDATYIRVTITDTGHGLSENVYARAFEPFVSTREDRAGLGLTSVALIVRRFRGFLDIESDGTGPRVHIYLPALSPTAR
jgi:signal transduction histidine kinase